ncbi:MAG: Gfo/Idh/MocA family oxidoreductase [Planctomycetes bacterium]|nr:Gfo/Idh/MocA family oxidoreductase [Planctomycetota bacterium]
MDRGSERWRSELRQRSLAPSNPRPIVCIGAGGIVHDAHLPAYRAAGLPVAGVFDPLHERARSAVERFGLPRAFASFEEAVATPSAIFDIAVPPSELQRVVERLPAGSAALLQKPLGLDLAEATRIRAACRARNITAAVNLQLRFSPAFLALRDALARGLLGRPIELEVLVNCRMPWELWPFLEGLPRMELPLHSIHYIDTIRALLGEPLYAQGRTVKHPSAPRIASSRTTAILDYGDDVRCALSIHHHHMHGPRHQRSELRLEGTRGAARVVMGVNLDYPRGRPDSLEIALEGADWSEVPLVGNWFPDAFRGPMCALQCFASGESSELENSVDSAWRTMAVIEALYAADAARGAPVPQGDAS